MTTKITRPYIDDTAFGNLSVRPKAGNAQIATQVFQAASKPTQGSMYFDGSDYLASSATNALIFRTGKFTVDFFFKASTVNSSFRRIVTNNIGGVGATTLLIRLSNANKIQVYVGATLLNGATTISADTWYHVAVVRENNSGSVKIYLDGVLDASGTSTADISIDDMFIGGYYSTGPAEYFHGYITALRTEQDALYTADFSPPLYFLPTATVNTASIVDVQPTTTGLTDVSDSQLELSPNGDLKSSDFSPFDGRASAYFDGSGDYIQYPDAQQLFIETGPFTLEFWIKPNSLGSYLVVENAMWRIGRNGGYRLFINASGQFNLCISTGAFNTFPSIITSVDSVSAGQWSHVAIVRDSNNLINIFVNGVSNTTPVSYSATLNVQNSYSGTVVQSRIAASLADGTLYNAFPGYISNMRIDKSCFYTGNFTPSTAPLLPTPTTTFLGLHDHSFRDDSPVSRVPSIIAGNTTFTSESPFSGEIVYKEPVSYSTYFDGTDDYFYSTTPLLPATNTNTFTIEGWFFPRATPGDKYMIFGDGEPAANQLNIGLLMYSNRTVGLYWYLGSQSPYVFECKTTGTANVNEWNYVAIVVNNNAISIYLNSATPQTLTGYTTLTARTATGKMMAGLYNNALDYYGCISNMRVSTVARTISEVPTAPFETDDDTRWLVCRSNTLTDDSGNQHNPIIAGNNTKLVRVSPFEISHTSTTKTTEGSLDFDGANDQLTAIATSDFDFSVGSWTVDGWFYLNALGFSSNFLSVGTGGSALYSSLRVGQSDGSVFAGFGSGTWAWSSQNTSSTGVIKAKVWHHVAIVKDDTALRIFVDGYPVISGSTPNFGGGAAGTVYVGSYFNNYNNDGSWFNGYISNLRIVKGAALYTQPFTPKIIPSTNITNTTLLIAQTDKAFNTKAVRDISNSKIDITIINNATASSFSPKTVKGWYTYNGGGSFQITNQNDCFNFGSNDFTVEFWARVKATAAQTFFIDMRVNNNTNANLMFFTTGLNHGDGTSILSWSTAPYADNYGNWFHFAVVRNNDNASGDNFCAFVNGVPVDTGTFASAVNTGNMRIFGRWDNNYSNWDTDISNLRVSKTAVYTDFANGFTVPTQTLTALPETTVLAFHNGTLTPAEGTAEATVTAAATPVSYTGQAPVFDQTTSYSSSVYQGSMYFDGTGDYLLLPYSSKYASLAAAEDYSIEAWFFLNANSSDACIMSSVTAWATQFNFVLEVRANGDLRYWAGDSGTAKFTTGTGYIQTKKWYHVLVSRVSGTLRMFVNGEQYGSDVSDSHTMIRSPAATIGAFSVNGTGSLSGYLNGYISDLRIVKGSGVSSVTLPTSPLTAISNTALLLNFTDNTIVDKVTSLNVDTVGAKTSSVSPYQDPVGVTAGAPGYIIVNGEGFAPGTTVSIDNNYLATSVTRVNNNQLRVQLPSNIPTGTRDVYVIRPNGRFSILSNGITFV